VGELQSTLRAESARVALVGLLHDVHRARAALRVARLDGNMRIVHEGQTQFLASLSRYVQALESLRLPIPYRLRDDLRIYRQSVRLHAGHGRRGY
jgi:hypothetical protein